MTKDLELIFGSDPEVFIKDKNNNVIGSEKVLSDKVEFDFGNIIRDGIQVEFNPRPADNLNDFISNIDNSIKAIESIASDNDYTVSLEQVVDVTQEEMDSLSPDSKQFGCMPSYNAYNEKIDLPKDASKVLYRSGGGHIHISSNDNEVKEFIINNRDSIVKFLDAFVGLYLVQYENTEDVQRRRKYYGRAGEYRKPEYGLEYRVPSNIWLSNKELIPTMLRNINIAIDLCMSDKEFIITESEQNDIISCINNGNKELATVMYNTYISKY